MMASEAEGNGMSVDEPVTLAHRLLAADLDVLLSKALEDNP